MTNKNITRWVFQIFWQCSRCECVVVDSMVWRQNFAVDKKIHSQTSLIASIHRNQKLVKELNFLDRYDFDYYAVCVIPFWCQKTSALFVKILSRSVSRTEWRIFSKDKFWCLKGTKRNWNLYLTSLKSQTSSFQRYKISSIRWRNEG